MQIGEEASDGTADFAIATEAMHPFNQRRAQLLVDMSAPWLPLCHCYYRKQQE